MNISKIFEKRQHPEKYRKMVEEAHHHYLITWSLPGFFMAFMLSKLPRTTCDDHLSTTWSFFGAILPTEVLLTEIKMEGLPKLKKNNENQPKQIGFLKAKDSEPDIHCKQS